MKTSRFLFVSFPLIAASALAQISTVAPTTISAVPVSFPVAPVATQTPVPAITAPTARPVTPISTTLVPTTTVPNPTPTTAELTLTSSGETSLTLDVGFGIRAVLPSRVTVPVGERLRVTAPDMGPGIQYIWTKNGRAISAPSERTLVIEHVVSSDAGTYSCLFSTPTTLPQPSQSLVLGVGPTDRLLNLSTRVSVGAGADQGAITGFVVAAGGQGKKLIIRAVGPSLAQFGVGNALRAPVLRIFDGNGQPYTNGYAYPAVVGGPTYETDLAESLARTGAFPLPENSRDAVVMMPFVPGSYTAHVTSGDGTAGTVLLEIYEVP